MKTSRAWLLWSVSLVLAYPAWGTVLCADELAAPPPKSGHLMIVGGGLRPDNAKVFKRLLEHAGGKDKARFAVFPTASLEPSDAKQLKGVMETLGVPAENVQVIDLTVFNYEKQNVNPDLVKQLEACTGVYFEGGDQTRITKALYLPTGRDSPVLTAIRAVWRRGGVIAGSSAGAAVQSKIMISVSGLPDDSLDEGLDVLDFGITRNGANRGLFVSSGLGFFTGGIIDQHFSEYRGRLGRLSRVTCEERQRDTSVRYGFGIDENTVLDVGPDGSFEVLGERTVTVVDAGAADCKDGPLGCHITGVRLSCLEEGDRFDPATGQAIINADKRPIVVGTESSNGNFLIPDVAGRGAALDALYAGLADNTSRKQVGIALKHHQHTAHGWRFAFQKTGETKCFDGYVDGLYSMAVLNARLDIEPITGTLHSPDKRLPVDLPKPGAARTALEALWRRGILLESDERQLRPEAKITRAELAFAICQTLRLEPPRRNPPRIADVPEESPWGETIALAVGNKLMDLNEVGAFRPEATVSRNEGAVVLVRLAERYRGGQLPDEPPPSIAAAHLDRTETAVAIFKLIGFSWANVK